MVKNRIAMFEKNWKNNDEKDKIYNKIKILKH